MNSEFRIQRSEFPRRRTAAAALLLTLAVASNAAAGDRFASIQLQVLGQVEMIVPNRDELFEKLAPSFGITAAEAAEMPIVMVGTVEQICDDLIARREEFGLSYIVVHDMEAFAPVVARLAGS